jgi:hypothetical protein
MTGTRSLNCPAHMRDGEPTTDTKNSRQRTARCWPLWPRLELTVEGRSYEVRRNGKRTNRFRVPCDLVNAETGQQMLRIERKPEGRRIVGLIETPSHRYTFPVRGERQRFATMSAVDEGAIPSFAIGKYPAGGPSLNSFAKWRL